jgi:four helix bundle protein
VDRHTSLVAWQRCHALAVAVHFACRQLPPSERFELGSQLRRAATSASANVAEGYARFGAAELLHALSVALGSLAEIHALLLLARDLGYVTDEAHRGLDQLRDSAAAAVFGLQRRLREKGGRRRPS